MNKESIERAYTSELIQAAKQVYMQSTCAEVKIECFDIYENGINPLIIN
jgi:hypothetical protein